MEKNVLQAKLVCKRVIGNLDSTFVLSVLYPYAYGSPINRVSSGELWGLEPSHGPGYSSKTRASHIKYPIRLRSAQNCWNPIQFFRIRHACVALVHNLHRTYSLQPEAFRVLLGFSEFRAIGNLRRNNNLKGIHTAVCTAAATAAVQTIRGIPRARVPLNTAPPRQRGAEKRVQTEKRQTVALSVTTTNDGVINYLTDATIPKRLRPFAHARDTPSSGDASSGVGYPTRALSLNYHTHSSEPLPPSFCFDEQ